MVLRTLRATPHSSVHSLSQSLWLCNACRVITPPPANNYPAWPTKTLTPPQPRVILGCKVLCKQSLTSAHGALVAAGRTSRWQARAFGDAMARRVARLWVSSLRVHAPDRWSLLLARDASQLQPSGLAFARSLTTGLECHSAAAPDWVCKVTGAKRCEELPGREESATQRTHCMAQSKANKGARSAFVQ